MTCALLKLKRLGILASFPLVVVGTETKMLLNAFWRHIFLGIYKLKLFKGF